MSAASEAAAARRERCRAEGRCTICGKAIGEPPQPWACADCTAKDARRCRTRRKRVGAPVINPTFADFEAYERRRGRA